MVACVVLAGEGADAEMQLAYWLHGYELYFGPDDAPDDHLERSDGWWRIDDSDEFVPLEDVVLWMLVPEVPEGLRPD